MLSVVGYKSVALGRQGGGEAGDGGCDGDSMMASESAREKGEIC